MANKMLFGIIGRSLSHSFSPTFFNTKFLKENIDAEYLLFDIQSVEELPRLIDRYPHLKGLSVTIPYKQQVFKYLNGVSDEAEEIGAVNCIKITEKGLFGFNTDAIGFKNSLKPLIKNQTGLRALILGTGGASKAVRFVLNKLNIPNKLVSRSKGDNLITYGDIDKQVIENHSLIINTTPLGMFPDVEGCPAIPYEHLTARHILYDLIYNPEETLFLRKGRREGAVIKNGFEMLHLQAEAAWNIWNE